MSDDMLNLAVPSLARELGASVAGVQWVLNSYYVTLVAFVLVAGSVGDIVGHGQVFLTGLAAFSAGALLCATAPGVAVLVVGRALQGAAAAMVLTAGLALVTSSTPAESRERAVGRFFGLVAAVPALGPFASGVLVDLLSWRWMFVLPLVLPVTASAIVVRRVARAPRGARRHPDLMGSLMLLLALSGLSVALITGRDSSPVTLPATVLAVVATAGFLLVERRSQDPLLPLALFRRRRFVGGNIVWLLACLTSWGATFFLAVTLQTTLGYRPAAAGLLLTPIYAVMMVGSPLAGRLAQRVGPTWPVVGGLVVYVAGLWMLSAVGAGTSLARLLTSIGVFAVGMAALTAPLATATLGALDETDQGLASGVNNAMGQLAGLLAIVVLPAAAGLSGGSAFGGVEFAAGYASALRVATALAALAVPIALVTLWKGPGGSWRPPADSDAPAADATMVPVTRPSSRPDAKRTETA
jgi:EmrB/QacA subfamily drug resistance transporter